MSKETMRNIGVALAVLPPPVLCFVSIACLIGGNLAVGLITVILAFVCSVVGLTLLTANLDKTPKQGGGGQ